jgi:hypothetical protein
MRQNKYEYDAFISHAVEDKIPIANELCARLEMAGLKIWYSGKELGVGDSIEKTIEKGLNRSRYGIVIFSPTYLAKNWTIREFYTLLAKEIEEQKVILPVLYNVTVDELKNKDLLMADRFAVNADRGIDFVVERLVKEIKNPKVTAPRMAWLSRIWLVLILSLLANVALILNGTLPARASLQLRDAELAERGDSGPFMNAALLSGMEGIFKQMNACSCDHRHERNDPGARNAMLASNPRMRVIKSEDGGGSGHRTDPAVARKAGSKMTMAVVFQIETAPEPQPTFNDEVNDLLQTIGVDENGGEFITVANKENPLERPQHECSRAGYIGE